MARFAATGGRLMVAIACVWFGVQHFAFPKFAPGVPLPQSMPLWVPLPTLLSYATGSILVACGVAFFSRWRKAAAVLGGLTMIVLTVFLYTPILVGEVGTPLVLEGVNYIGDCLLFAATLMLAGYTEQNRIQFQKGR